MKIALDAMGGDYAPYEIIKGAIDAVNEYNIEIILVGDKDKINQELKKYPKNDKIYIEYASEVIEMDEEPAYALRKKKDASISVATKILKEKRADALVSAGSTGAQMASSLLILGRIKGIKRPAIATVFPTKKGGKLLLDVGANTNCKPLNLLQYAYMGSIYTEKILGIKTPKVGLLNIGSEETKGNDLTKETYKILKNEKLNFIGNIEAREITNGNVDVIVCDGFVGNTIIKFAEGLAKTFFNMMKKELQKSFIRKIGAFLCLPIFKGLKKSLDYSEYGGAPLLGVNGVSIICHGSSNAKAVKNAIAVAIKCVENNFVNILEETIPPRERKEEHNE